MSGVDDLIVDELYGTQKSDVEEAYIDIVDPDNDGRDANSRDDWCNDVVNGNSY